MSCPLFEPTARLPWERWDGRYRPPLGALYQGLCHARATPVPAQAAELVDCCNMGYARGRCPHLDFPGPDATRFELVLETADRLEVAWVVERNCLPEDRGVAVFERAEGEWRICEETATPLRRQIEAFVASWQDAGGGG